MYAIDDLSLHIDNMSTCEEEQEQQDTEYKETDKCEKKTLRQKLKELEAKEATEDELRKLEIVKRALMLKEEKDEINPFVAHNVGFYPLNIKANISVYGRKWMKPLQATFVKCAINSIIGWNL